MAHRLEQTGENAAERGFALLDITIALALFAGLVLATATALGPRPARTHAAALALERALIEARALALANADATAATYATGATVVVADDPSDAHGSIIGVYRSRPIPNPGGEISAPTPELGFPPQRVGARFIVRSSAASEPSPGPFLVMLSSAGYASIETGAYDPDAPLSIAQDPGCDDAGVTITAVDGDTSEAHAFACRGGVYAASQ